MQTIPAKLSFAYRLRPSTRKPALAFSSHPDASKRKDLPLLEVRTAHTFADNMLFCHICKSNAASTIPHKSSGKLRASLRKPGCALKRS